MDAHDRLLPTGRPEAFSDGVFAIAITGSAGLGGVAGVVAGCGVVLGLGAFG